METILEQLNTFTVEIQKIGPEVLENETLSELPFGEQIPDYVLFARDKYGDAVKYYGIISCVIFGWSMIEFFASGAIGGGYLLFNFDYFLNVSYVINVFTRLVAFVNMIFYFLTFGGVEKNNYLFYISSVVSKYYYCTAYWIGGVFFIIAQYKEDFALVHSWFFLGDLVLGFASIFLSTWQGPEIMIWYYGEN